MNLNFTEYLKTDVEMPVINLPDKNALGMPDVPEGTPLSPYYEHPAVSIPLDAMEQWVSSINLNGKDCTAVIVKDGAALKDALQMAVPAFGIGSSSSDFKQGVAAGGDLVFSAGPEGKELKPKTEPVEIYLQLTQVPPSSGTYDVEVDLRWTKAQVYPGDEGYEGKITLSFEDFAKFSDKYKIASIPCYLYIGGPFTPDNSVEVGLRSETDWLVGDGAAKGQGEEVVTDCGFKWDENLFSGDTYGGDLDGEAASFNLASKVSDSSGGNLELDYYIRMMNDSWEVYSDAPNGVIFADMVVILPLQFNLVEDGKKVKSINGENYISIMSMLDYGSGAGSDLFGRGQAGGFSNFLTGIRVSGKDMKNTLFADGLFLHVYQDGVVEELVAVKAGNSFSVDIAGSPIPAPFHPEFGVCALKPHSGKAVMRIMPKVGEDDFSLWFSADVTGMVEYNRDL
jgi:hypothetical protein